MGLRAFFSRRVVTPQGLRACAVLVDDGRILGLVAQGEVPAYALREDFGDVVILPGLVDSHVHINEPGRTDWEGFETATRAAAAGGYTTVVDMPLNCVPPTTDIAGLEAKRSAAHGKCWIDWIAWGGLVPDQPTQIPDLVRSGVAGFKCFLVHPGVEEFAMVCEKDLRETLPVVARSRLPLLVHAEMPAPIDVAEARLRGEDWNSYATYLESRPDEAERQAIELMLALCREYGFRLHIVHLSTASALDRLAAAKREGLSVSVETCPHYLHLVAEGIADGMTVAKCAPPIRSGANREQLWEGLRNGVIDMVVTDHSPCPPAMKARGNADFRDAWGGIAGLSMALPVVWTEARRRGFSLENIVRWMAERPAQLAGCGDRKGLLAAGYDADFTLFDPDTEFTVSPDQLHQRYKVSPYLGETLCGVVKRTYLRGRLVYRDGEFCGEPVGREVPRPQ